MTRETLDEIRSDCKNDDCVVEILFDYINNRTCKNCFNLMPFTVDDEDQCYVFIAGMEEFMFKDVSTFGCNSFVSADTKGEEDG